MIRFRQWSALVLTLWLFGELTGTAQADDVQVNTYTTGDQRNPSVVFSPSGGFVVVWQSLGSSGTDSDGYSIQGQHYASDGNAVGGEFQVNTYTSGDQRYPSLAVSAAGDFLVVWGSDGSGGSDSSSSSIQGRRYASDGSPVNGEFQVNTYTTSDQFRPSASFDADGDFVVVWGSDGSGGTDTDGTSIQGQRFASDGSMAGDQFQVNTYTTSTQGSYVLGHSGRRVAVSAGGDFVVVWDSLGSPGTDALAFSIQGQRFAADGSPVGDQFQANTYTFIYQRRPVVGLAASGDFVIVWDGVDSSDNDTSSYSIQGQRFASDGSALGGEFQINSYTTANQLFPSLAVAADGDFFVAWQSFGSSGTDSSSFSIQGQRYAADGLPVDGELQVNSYTTSTQGFPSVALTASGEFVVAWNSDGSGGTDTTYSVQLTRGTQLIFADGFESGDTTSWSQTTTPF